MYKCVGSAAVTLIQNCTAQLILGGPWLFAVRFFWQQAVEMYRQMQYREYARRL